MSLQCEKSTLISELFSIARYTDTVPQCQFPHFNLWKPVSHTARTKTPFDL